MAQPRTRRLAAYLLGAFVCAELIYLPLANVLQLFPRRMPPVPDEILGRLQREGRSTRSDAGQVALDSVGAVSDRYGEATAQGQNWSLFAPTFGQAGTFLALQVTTADGPVELRSRFEPADPDHYVRFDVVNYRFFYREMSYAIVYWDWTPGAFAAQGPEWRDAVRRHVGTFPHTLPAYVRWRLDRELPGAAVREVIVAVRVFLPPKPGEGRPAPVTLPLARWAPERPVEVTAYDPVTQLFDRDPPTP
jgi:hypothetical protein